MPETADGGANLYATPSEMVPVYLFHVVRNHPFAGSNKRTGRIAALAFLGPNDPELHGGADAPFELVMGPRRGR